MARHTFRLEYLSQLDNALYPHGTCNTTCLAMAFKYYGIKVAGQYSQIEDNITDYAERNGYDRHKPEDMAAIASHLGMGDQFTAGATWGEITEHLRANHPVIVHGYFTPSGHIVILHGFDDTKGFLTNDPNGIWPYSTWDSGEDVWYGYNFMKAKCGPDGDLWAHFLKADKRA